MNKNSLRVVDWIPSNSDILAPILKFCRNNRLGAKLNHWWSRDTGNWEENVARIDGKVVRYSASQSIIAATCRINEQRMWISCSIASNE